MVAILSSRQTFLPEMIQEGEYASKIANKHFRYVELLIDALPEISTL